MALDFAICICQIFLLGKSELLSANCQPSFMYGSQECWPPFHKMHLVKRFIGKYFTRSVLLTSAASVLKVRNGSGECWPPDLRLMRAALYRWATEPYSHVFYSL